jgi:DNA-binding CsgD family transcriptional regulator
MIYDVGIDQARWQALLTELSGVFDGANFVLKGIDLASNLSIMAMTTGYDPDFLRTYDHYAARNPWVPIQARMPLGSAHQPEEFLAYSELTKTEFYNDWLRPQGVDTAAGMVLHRDPKTFFALSGDFSLRRADRLQGSMLDVLGLLAPHLYRAFALNRRMASLEAREAFRSEYDASAYAVFVVDVGGFVVQANGRGEALRMQSDPLRYDAGGRLRLFDTEAQTKLELALLAIDSAAYGRLPDDFTARGASAFWLLSIAPYSAPASSAWLAHRLSDRVPVAIVHIKAPDAVHAFAARASLTDAELALVRGLCDARSLDEIAAAKGASINTVRNQLKSVFAKTGTHRQAELVAMVRRAISIEAH